VRFFGFFVATYAAMLGMAPTAFIWISLMGLVVVFIYMLGSSKKTGIPIKALILGKSAVKASKRLFKITKFEKTAVILTLVALNLFKSKL